MTELSDEVKTLIVQSLAMYSRPAQVAALVKAEYEVVVDRRLVQYYDPTKGAATKRLSERWVNLFNTTRKKYDDEVANIPVAKQSYRLTMLQRMAERAEGKQQYGLAAELLKQAAQDRGGVFTNAKKITIDDPLQTLAELLNISQDELPDDMPGLVH
jgi:hypothetical protein